VSGGEFIREMRFRAILSQAALAEAVGVGTPHISKIETGAERPSVELCYAIAEVLPCDGERLAAMFGYLPEWADRALREHPMLALLMLAKTAQSVGLPSVNRQDVFRQAICDLDGVCVAEGCSEAGRPLMCPDHWRATPKLVREAWWDATAALVSAAAPESGDVL